LPPMPPEYLDYLQSAVCAGIPFVITKYADTKSYGAREAWEIAISRTRVVVIDERDPSHVFPKSTMTGISYLSKENGEK